MSYNARTQKAIAARRKKLSQQFGQTGDATTANGALGCTHTVLQFLAYLWTGKWYTQDQVSRMAGYPDQSDVPASRRRGLRPSEVQRFCTKVGLPYVLKFGLTPEELLRIANERGPIGFGESYSYHPECYGFRYGGRVADGQPNGYAHPLRKSGRTQLTGFSPPNDAHFALLLGYDGAQAPRAARCLVWEPNHGSPARPERPPHDRVTTAQFARTYRSYKTVLGRTLYALVPTRRLPA